MQKFALSGRRFFTEEIFGKSRHKTQQILDGFASILTKDWRKSTCKKRVRIIPVTLGSYLLKTVIDELENSGYHELTVGVEDDNIHARYMYEKCGFVTQVARIRETYQGDSYEYDLLLRHENA